MSSSPTVAECDAQLQAAVILLELMKDAASVSSTNWLARKDTLIQALEGEFAGDLLTGVKTLEGRLDAVLSRGGARLILDPIMRTYGQAIGAPVTDPELLARVYIPRYNHDTGSRTIKTRAMTYGSPTADGGNTGDAVINQLAKDADNYDPENVYAEAWRAECLTDASGGVKRNREILRLTGASKWATELQRTGSGTDTTLALADHTDSMVRNAGFDQTDSATTPTALTEWTSSTAVVGDGSDYTFDASNIYQARYSASEVRYAINVKLTRDLTQRLDARGTAITRPIYGQIAYNRAVGAASGTLALTLGALTASVAVAAQTGWNLLRLPLTTTAWPRNLYADPLTLTISWTRTAGELLLDDLVVVPYVSVANQYLCAVGGQSPLQERDFFTWTLGHTGAVIQEWIWRAYDAYWPHSATPDIADPS